MKNTKSVDYQEALSIKVGRFLISKGFDLASCTGIAENSLVWTCSVGILRRDPEAKPRRFLFGLIELKPRREFLGTIWFGNNVRGATEQNWVFEIFDQNHIELIRQLANEMASTFNVKITCRLVSERPRVEVYLSDITK